MIFSHAPAGFLVAYFTRKYWAQKLSEKQINYLYFLGAIFGIFPDIDVFYFYFFDATLRHREFITHSLILYLLILIVLYFIAKIIKSGFVKALNFVFFFAVLSHLILDSLTAGIMWIYPFSHYTYGLLNFNFLANSFYGHYVFYIDMFFEIIILILAFNILFYKFYKKYLSFSLLFSYLFLVLMLIFFYILWPHSYSGGVDFYYKDKDKDGIINMRDLDIDGDNIPNIKDSDADGDGIKNIDQILLAAQRVEGVWHDRFEGGFFEIPSRFGLLAKIDVARKTYEQAGIFFRREMQEDFKKRPYEYEGTPKDSRFDCDIYNLFVFLRNNGMMIDGKRLLRPGDIVFYGESLNNIGLAVSKKNEKPRVLILNNGIMAIVYNYEAIKEFGEIKAIGRMKYKN